jgi:hypothetical protein
VLEVCSRANSCPFLVETRPKKWVGDGAALEPGGSLFQSRSFIIEDGGALGVFFGARG